MRSTTRRGLLWAEQTRWLRRRFRWLWAATVISVLPAVGCDWTRSSRDQPGVTSERATTQATQAPPSGSGAAADPELDWTQAVSRLRSALAKGSVKLVMDPSNEVRTTGCDGKPRPIELKGRTVRGSFPCFVCMPVQPDAGGTPTGGSVQIVADVAVAFGRYPATVIKQAELKAVRLCGAIFGKKLHHETIGGTVDLYERTLLVSVRDVGLTGETIFHHELFHHLDNVLFFDITWHTDREWLATNDPSFRYGVASSDAGAVEGMLNHQSVTSEREDRAVVYQYMMADPDELCRRMSKDRRIAAKARLLRARLKAAFSGDVEFLDRRVPCFRRGG